MCKITLLPKLSLILGTYMVGGEIQVWHAVLCPSQCVNAHTHAHLNKYTFIIDISLCVVIWEAAARYLGKSKQDRNA